MWYCLLKINNTKVIHFLQNFMIIPIRIVNERVKLIILTNLTFKC